MRRSDRQISNVEEIHEILKKALVCRLALSDCEQPYLVSLNFGVEFSEPLKIYFHCAPEGRKIDIIRKNNKACFQADTNLEILSGPMACDWGMHFRSVIAFGTIEIVENIAEKYHGLNAIMTHYSNADRFEYDEKVLNKTTILRMTIDEITAKHK
jgi:nitroimidazol reductase NimA-like FMN-containing flavoprotein (pyridoxamine 5'-phosphate oxidase superfamily)